MSQSSPLQALRHYFGYEKFRPLQAEIIDHVLDKQDGLVIMPTGGGKSLCYQVPALVQPGMAVVISPLISLMRDQVMALKANGVSAAYINSSQSAMEQRSVETQALDGQLKILYVSPEKALSQDFLNLAKAASLSLIAVDEAHCISAWGHDFRPEYTQLKLLRQQFPGVPILALTATADKVTRRDILDQLGISEARTFLASFDRPNLSLNVAPAHDRVGTIIDIIKQRPNDSGIVYCLSRKATESLAEKLEKKGIKAAAYHAGMSPEKRHKVQEDFIADRMPVICATIAFGMGIDKSNVRWVIHYNLPKNMEGYYQEIGRAGRDGLPSTTLLFFTYSDVITLRSFIEDSGQKDLQSAKLDRMVQYAQARTCRRKILLSYFGEILPDNCGNCDVCKNPPKEIDGTVIAQKALSCVARLNQQAGMQMVIDVLRGSGRREVMERGYHQIKTYGVGSGISFADWQEYFTQLINLGLLEIAYDQHYALRLTEASRDVLMGNTPVMLADKSEVREEVKAASPRKKSKTEALTEALFEQLRGLRRQIADSSGIAPYVVFHDKSLTAMAEDRPLTEDQMMAIEGVSDAKMDQYGDTFLNEIRRFMIDRDQRNQVMPKESHLVTFAWYCANTPVAVVAQKRGVKEGTIYGHLEKLHQQGFPVDLASLFPKAELQGLFDHFYANGLPSEGLKPLFEHFEGKIGYGKLRIALALYRQRNRG